MKRIFSIMTALLLACAMLWGCAPKNDTKGAAESMADEYAFNTENQAYWRERLQYYRKDDGVRQIMLVRCTEGSNATVQFYTKLTNQNNAWTLLFETDAYIGKNGAGKTQEGDAKTPYGDFGVITAYGILDDPGTKLDYISEYYNRIIDTRETGHACNGEEMFIYTPEYNYGIALDYNLACEWPLGSSIFLHCKGAKVFTGGCVAIDEELMKLVLQNAEPGMRVIIHED